MRDFITKPTLFSILGLIIIVIGLPLGMYMLNLEGPKAMMGVFVLAPLMATFFLIFIDRILVKKINNRKLSLYELGALILFISLYLFNNQQMRINFQNPKDDFVIVVRSSENLSNDRYKLNLVFNKVLSTTDNIVVISEEDYDCTNPQLLGLI